MKKIATSVKDAFEQDYIIAFLFSFLLFTLPLIFLPITSELFEFNKLVLVYIFTILIYGVWCAKMIILKKIIFKRTLLDIPLVLFLLSQLASTIFSIDIFTSIFGYYSRFNGGLLSTLAYILLYWAYSSNMTAKSTKKVINSMLASGMIVGIWGILEHFGLSPSCILLRGEWNADCWVQEVQKRVFATMGQPNWLAAYIAALAPFPWSLAIAAKDKYKKLTIKNYWVYHVISLIFFCTILFTKSRSGILAFGIIYFIFWIILFISKQYRYKLKKEFFTLSSLLAIATIIFGTPWTPSLSNVISHKENSPAEIISQAGTVIELDGTESGTLRQIVWRGTFDIWREYPIFGTGVETFAYAYYQFRPIDHNLTSEWDFLYNKAHNEFLNYAANSGTLGILSYLAIIGTFIILAFKYKSKNIFIPAVLCGFLSLIITNFFGFSVVVTSIQFFLFPAMIVSLKSKSNTTNIVVSHKTFSNTFKLFSLAGIIGVLLFLVIRYWHADVLYARGKSLLATGQINPAIQSIKQAVFLSPYTAAYYDQLAAAYAQSALTSENDEEALAHAELSKHASDKAYALSPRNINLAKSRSNTFVDLSQIKADYLLESMTTLQRLIAYAPTDPSVYQMMGLTLAQAGYPDQAIEFIKEAINLKPDYKRARLTLNYIYKQQGRLLEASEQLQYILDNISPDDSSVKQQLDDLMSIEEENK